MHVYEYPLLRIIPPPCLPAVVAASWGAFLSLKGSWGSISEPGGVILEAPGVHLDVLFGAPGLLSTKKSPKT